MAETRLTLIQKAWGTGRESKKVWSSDDFQEALEGGTNLGDALVLGSAGACLHDVGWTPGHGGVLVR